MPHPVSRNAALALVTLALIIVAVPTEAQGPDVQRLHWFAGEWTYEVGDGGGTVVGRTLASGRLVEWMERYQPASGDPLEIVHVFGYDPGSEAYYWHRYMPNGSVQIFGGWVDGKTWTFLHDDGTGTLYRLTAVEESATAGTFAWARSVKGGAWEETARGQMTKVK